MKNHFRFDIEIGVKEESLKNVTIGKKSSIFIIEKSLSRRTPERLKKREK